MSSRPAALILFRSLAPIFRQTLSTVTRVARSCGFEWRSTGTAIGFRLSLSSIGDSNEMMRWPGTVVPGTPEAEDAAAREGVAP